MEIHMRKWIIAVMLVSVLALAGCGAENTADNLNDDVKEETTQQSVATTEVAAEADEASEGPTESAQSQERQPAIDFTMTGWQGDEITLSGYEGKIVFLNFFATWCPPCQEEMPEFQQAYEDYEGDVVFQIIDVYSSEREGYQQVVDWYTDGGYTMPMIIDEEGQLEKDYPVRAFPTTFVIDREGNVLGYLEGAMTREMVDSIIEQADM